MIVSLIVIAQLVIFFLTQQNWLISVQSLNSFGLIPMQLLQNSSLHTVITAMWIHENVYHLLGNIFLLWIFGKDVEKKLHPLGFLVYYLSIGILANLLAVLYFSNSSIPILGSSGVVSGIIAAHLVLSYNKPILLHNFFSILRVIAYVCIMYWFVFQLVTVLSINDIRNIPLLIHVSAFLMGIISMFGIMYFCFQCADSY